MEFGNNIDFWKLSLSTPSVEIKKSKDIEYKVTIAIPTFKRPDLLARAIESAINQIYIYIYYEILVVDNNPERNDNTEKCILSKFKNVPNLSYYKNAQNIEMPGNWDKLYQLAKGKYVIMLHDDDMLYPDYLKRVFVDFKETLYKSDILLLNICTEVQCREYYNLPNMVLKLSINDMAFHNYAGAPSGMCTKKKCCI